MSQKFTVDSDAVLALAKILQDTGLTEIEYEENSSRIRVAKTPAPQNFHSAPGLVAPVASAAHELSIAAPINEASGGAIRHTKDLSQHPGAVKSPMVGTAYISSAPGQPPFVKVGDSVTMGQTIMIIEAMKVMNPIKASKAGKVSQILVGDSEPVEFGEVLVIIE